MGGELGRIDEDRYHHLLGPSFGEPDQRDMAVVERAHGRDECDRRVAGAQAIEGAVQGRDRAGDQGGLGHLHSRR